MPVVLVCKEPSISDVFTAQGSLVLVGRTLIHPFWAVEPHGVPVGDAEGWRKMLKKEMGVHWGRESWC